MSRTYKINKPKYMKKSDRNSRRGEFLEDEDDFFSDL